MKSEVGLERSCRCVCLVRRKTTIDIQAEQLIASDLEPGERLLWVGRAARGVRFRPSDMLLIPFSVLLVAFAVFWEMMVLQTSAPLFFRFAGSVFVVLGAYMLVARFLWDAWRRSHTSYAVTDRRILIVTDAARRSPIAYSLKDLPAMTLTERRKGSGDIK
jgi:hypothetical protein